MRQQIGGRASRLACRNRTKSPFSKFQTSNSRRQPPRQNLSRTHFRHKPVRSHHHHSSTLITHTKTQQHFQILRIRQKFLTGDLLLQQSWVKESPVVSTPPASCKTTAASSAGPICHTRSVPWERPSSPRPSEVPPTPRASSSRRSVSRPSSPTPLSESASGCN